MNDIQKNTIIQMRRGGKSYAQIAAALDIPQNTVKTFCNRNKDTLAVNISADVCKQCGKEVAQKPHRKIKRFCSDTCRQAWWNDNRDQVNKKGAHTITCAFCGSKFESYDVGRRYCCHVCYISDRFKKGHNRHDTRAV